MAPSPIAKYAVIAILAIGAVLLLAFGPRAGADVKDRAQGRTVIEYWEKWTNKEGEALHKLVDEYNDTQGKTDGIYVNCLTTSEIGKKTLVAIASGTPPDVAGLWDYNLVQYASLNAIEPLDEMAKAKGIGESYYKPIYWKAITWDNHLYALVSTPAAVALHYHKKIFQENAAALRAAGLDPDRPPETLDELDRYAAVLDVKDPSGHVIRAGQLPAQPGWFLRYISIWFGKEIWDDKAEKFQLTDPQVIKAFDWIASYSRRLGKDATNQFNSGLGTFDSPQNGFFFDPTDPNASPRIVMEQQGPWTANFIYNRAPKMSTLLWPRIHDKEKDMDFISEEEFSKTHEERVKNYEWAVAPFPSAVGEKDVTYAQCDILVIPKGARHPKESFQFMAWMNSQYAMEKLCQAHSKNSPLTKVSPEFFQRHTNPYIDVFERLASSPNAHIVPKMPINQEVADEMDAVIQSVTLLKETPEVALANAQKRLQAKYDDFMDRLRARQGQSAKAGGVEK